MLRSGYKLLYHLAIDGRDRFYPLLAVYYLTYRCQFRCPYCSDGEGRPYYQLPAEMLSADRVFELLAIVRRKADYLVLTGGEPLDHPEVSQILRSLPKLGFRGLIFTTNGYRLDEHLPLPRGAVTELVLSVDTLDAAKADAWHGVGPGTHDRILKNLERAAHEPGRDYRILVSTVVTPDNLDDVFEVYDFVRARSLRFAAFSQLVGVKAHSALGGDPRYRRFYDLLIAEKRAGRPIHGTVRALEYTRDLCRFRCRPFTMLTVSPEGDVFYPCLEAGQKAGNILVDSDLHALRRAACARLGPQPVCDARCHSACALGFSLGLAHPFDAVHEGLLGLKGAWQRRMKAREAGPSGS